MEVPIEPQVLPPPQPSVSLPPPQPSLTRLAKSEPMWPQHQAPIAKTKRTRPRISPSEPIILQDPQVALAQQKADTNKIHGEPRGGGATSDSNLDSTDCNSESSNGSKSQELPDLPSSSSSSAPSVLAGSNQPHFASEKRLGPSLPGSREEKVMVSISKPQQK